MGKFKVTFNKNKFFWVLFLLLSIASTFTFHFGSALRLVYSLRDLCTSFVLWLFFLVRIDAGGFVPATILTYDFENLKRFIAIDVDELLRRLKALPSGVFNLENFRSYLSFVGELYWEISFFVLLFLPLFLALYAYVYRLYTSPRKIKKKKRRKKRSEPVPGDGAADDGAAGEQPIPCENTKQLDFYLRRIRPFILRVLERFYTWFLSGCKKWWIFASIVWSVNLNLASIAVSAFAGYFYLLTTLNPLDFVYLFGKFLLDLVLMFSGAPFVFWCIVFYILIDLYRKFIGYKKLARGEEHNRTVINKLPLNVLIVGWMAAGKTTTGVDMTLSFAAMIKDWACEDILKLTSRFPNFPFRRLELKVEEGISKGKLKHCLDCVDYIDACEKKFVETKDKVYLFEYDYERFELLHDNGLTLDSVFNVLRDYMQLYFLYTLDSSMILSSIAIRGDMQRIDNGYFPLWDTDFFHRPSFMRVSDSDSMSHIIDFDMFRRGKKMDPKNPNVGAFEFGSVFMSEKGKERGNALDNKGYKRDDPFPNPLNDLFNADLKMRRHNGTILYRCYVKFFSDEQREISINADEREITQVIRMGDCEYDKVVLPLFSFMDSLDRVWFKKFNKFFLKQRSVRDDENLLTYILKNIVYGFHGYVERYRNVFGVKKMCLKLISEEEELVVYYYLSKKKIFSTRFYTDCLKAIFSGETRRCSRGLKDIPRFKNVLATMDELKLEHSYFISDIEKFASEAFRPVGV